jgi:hypothetical protein
MPQVSEIRSNLRRATTTYDEEMDLPQHVVEEYNTRPVIERRPTTVELESIALQYERNYNAAKDQRWHDQQRFMGKENEAMRLVNIMHPHKIFRLLRRAGVDARIEAPTFDVWVPDDETGRLIKIERERSNGRLWLANVAINGRVGVSAWVTDKETGERKRRQVTTLQWPCGPEWSLLHFDEFDVPITEKYRGWRTAMLQMILQDVVTEEEVNRAFGPVPLHSVSLHYRQQLYTHRQRRVGLIQ